MVSSSFFLFFREARESSWQEPHRCTVSNEKQCRCESVCHGAGGPASLAVAVAAGAGAVTLAKGRHGIHGSQRDPEQSGDDVCISDERISLQSITRRLTERGEQEHDDYKMRKESSVVGRVEVSIWSLSQSRYQLSAHVCVVWTRNSAGECVCVLVWRSKEAVWGRGEDCEISIAAAALCFPSPVCRSRLSLSLPACWRQG